VNFRATFGETKACASKNHALELLETENTSFLTLPLDPDKVSNLRVENHSDMKAVFSVFNYSEKKYQIW